MTNGSELTNLLEIIQEVDTNEDGYIDFSEFKAAMKKKGTLDDKELKKGLMLQNLDIEKAQVEGKVNGPCVTKISG